MNVLLALKELLNECGIGKIEDAGGIVNSGDPLSVDLGLASHRVLIFCQQRTMLDVIENELFKKHMKDVTYVRMDGDVPPVKRGPLVKRFNEDPSIDCFLLTTSIGGLGLNLTGADTVIFVEHDWNPMKDLQAMDRAHRIGATRTVNVYRLITLGTLEEKIMSLQKFKIHTANTVINAENQSFATMDTSTLLGLFKADEGPKKQNSADPSKILDEFGNVVGGANTGEAKALLDGLGELWNESQYSEEFDVDAFVKNLKK